MWLSDKWHEVLAQDNVKFGTDGSGGKAAKYPLLRHVGSGIAAAAVINGRISGELACAYALTPGRQTVPRAELNATVVLTELMSAAHKASATTYVNAQYVVHGIQTYTRKPSVNDDLRREVEGPALDRLGVK